MMTILFRSPDETILDRLRAHAETSPDRLAYRFLSDDGGSNTLTFRQLDRRARGLAARLREHAAPGDRALLLYTPGLEFIEAFLGCLAAGVIAVPAYPPRRNRKDERLRVIVEDAKPRLILTSRQILPTIEASEIGGVNGLSCLATDAIEGETDGNRSLPNIIGDTVAFLQYTSGSTRTPQGVIVTHGNLAFNERQIQASFRHTRHSVMVSWLPVFHDMGLVGGVLQPLFVGFPSVLLSPLTFLREPVRWLRAITEYRGTTTGAPNFAYDHCAKLVSEEQKRNLDLSSLTVAFNGSEPVRAESLDRFTAAFARCGFRREAFFPCYGLAEATLFVSGGPAGEEPRRCCVDPSALEAGQVVTAETPGGRWLVGSGQPAEGTKVVAVDPTTRMAVPSGQVGELWVSSPSIAAGYWGQAGKRNTAYENHLANGEGPFLSTGDLGFLDGDEVFITGRSKDVIIIHGRNIYPQDVEAAVARVLPFVEANSCAAFAVEENGRERMSVVIEADRGLVRTARIAVEGDGKAETAVAELALTAGKVRQVIGDEFEVPVHTVAFVRPGSFPRTSSGKVQRRACRDGLQDRTLALIHMWSEAPNRTARRATSPGEVTAESHEGDEPPRGGESGRPCAGRRWNANPQSSYASVNKKQIELAGLVHDIFVRWLRAEVDPTTELIDWNASFVSLGLDSIGAATVAREITKSVGLDINSGQLSEYPTVNRLAEFLSQHILIVGTTSPLTIAGSLKPKAVHHQAVIEWLASNPSSPPTCLTNGKTTGNITSSDELFGILSPLNKGDESTSKEICPDCPPIAVFEDTTTLRMAFNVMPSREVEEVLILKEYRVWNRYAEGVFSRKYLSQMLASPDHLIFLTALAHAQKLAYVCLSREFGIIYEPGSAEQFKIWPTHVQVSVPELITRSADLVQKLWITSLIRRDARQYDVSIRTVVESLTIVSDARVILLGGRT
jgi:acyl-CoA synthetase (AMP-forming)/AMP-acid ligase II/acyl carrier protein